MDFKKLLPIYAMFVGVSIILTWIFFFATGTVPALAEEPLTTWFHILAEAVTAVVLIAGGAGMRAGKPWGMKAYMLGLGMILYALINSPGFYAQRGYTFLLFVFAGSFVFTVIAVVLSFIKLDIKE